MYNLLIVGDNGVGKTSFINKHKTGNFITSEETNDILISNILNFNTSEGKITINTSEIANSENFGFISEIHMTIIMFDLTELKTYENVKIWYTNIRNVFKDVPIVLCGNKSDIGKDVVESRVIFDLCKELNIQYNYLSVKNGHNIETPFLSLLRKVKGNDKLKIENNAEPNQEIKYNNVQVIANTELEVKAEETNAFKNMLTTLKFLMSENLQGHVGLLDINNIENTDAGIMFKFGGKKYKISIARE